MAFKIRAHTVDLVLLLAAGSDLGKYILLVCILILLFVGPVKGIDSFYFKDCETHVVFNCS